MLRYTVVQNDEVLRLAPDPRSNIQLLDNYFEYHDKFVSMLIEFHLTCVRHLSCIRVARHRIELVADNKQPVH